MSKITKSARGKPCSLRLGRCSSEETVVLCHINKYNNRIGHKAHDIHGVYGCSNCHDVIDGRDGSIGFDDGDLLRALLETQRSMIADGLITYA